MPKGMKKVVGPGFRTAGAAKRIEKEKVAVGRELNAQWRMKQARKAAKKRVASR